jgi:phosphoribosylpyrophosphate synthetase
MVLVGDVKGKTAILVDDMADTCGTLVKAADVLIAEGAKDALAIVTHGILSGNAIEALNGSKLKKIVVTNTVPHEDKKELCDRIETIDISPTVSSMRTYELLHANLWTARRGLQADAQRRERIFPLQACARRLIPPGVA